MTAPDPHLPARQALILGFVALLTACSAPQATVGTMAVEVQVDGQELLVHIPSGSTAQEALSAAGIQLSALDRVDPPGYTVLTEGSYVVVTRVTERFEVELRVLPYERQTVRNEALPAGETRLLQPGENGQEEITYRILVEEGVEVSRQAVKRVVTQPPVPEIVMVGSQPAYTPLPVAGTLAYASAGNAWLIERDTGARRALVLSGDLDGRVFELSPDGRWLLFSRQEEGDEQINSLWLVSTRSQEPELIALEGGNVIHFAGWSPLVPPEAVVYTIAYSTVEPRPAAPGWQANNDLVLATLGPSGDLVRERTVLAPNAGGQYGWWGTSFAWSPDGDRLAYARADGIGIVPLAAPGFEPLLQIVPYQALGDWAWVPGIAWGHDRQTLFTVDHGPPQALEPPEASPIFDVVAFGRPEGVALPLSPKAGMFAYPTVSPATELATGEISFQIAFLEALDSLKSHDSRYRLVVMDRDGSNRRVLFPPQGEPGLEPQRVRWAPDSDWLAVIYDNDLWIIEAATGAGQRMTGDGQTQAVDWKP